LGLVDLERYKLVVILNTWHMDEEARRLVEERVKGGGRTVVWCYAPGYFEGSEESAELMEELTGLAVRGAEEESFVEPKVKLTEAGRRWMEKAGVKPVDEAFGMEGKICRLFYVERGAGEVLGVHEGSGKPALVRKAMDRWESIYSLSPVLSPSVVRALGKSAGVHVFNDRDDTLYANDSFICINASSAGGREIYLPRESNVYEAISGERWYEGVKSFETSLMEGETQIFRYEPSYRSD
jgi:hypothetical protein